MATETNKDVVEKVIKANEAKASSNRLGVAANPNDDNEASKENTKKRPYESSTEQVDKRVCAEAMDLAVKFGFQPGERLEVKWEVGEGESTTTTRWWKATLLEPDGRTEDGVAVRVLDYDPYPEGGFHERSQENVIFVSRNVLYGIDSDDELTYRKEGEEETVSLNNEQLEETLDAMLVGLLSKHGEMWRKLSPAQQAMLADKVSTGKERLLSVIQSKFEQGGVVTAADVPEVIEQAFRDM